MLYYPRSRVTVVCHHGPNRETSRSVVCEWSQIGEAVAHLIAEYQAEPDARSWWGFRASTKELSRNEERLLEAEQFRPLTVDAVIEEMTR